MLFNTLDFFYFFLIVTLVYFLLPHKFRWLHLLIASCYFYAAFIPVYILILFFTIVIDYIAGIAIEKADIKYKKRMLLISIIANVGILFFFKYFNFFIDNINTVSSLMGLKFDLPALSIILPIGLSFHTFQAMSYTIEVYRGTQKAERHFGIYALYVMFYPQLVAGPIERPQNVLHQFHEKHHFDIVNLWKGLRLMLWGLFKKVVIADRLSIFVDRVFESPEQHNSVVLILGAVFFAIQIYCDFSGYSDMAIGAAKTMGFDLMTNFSRPYFATNIKSFWDRWHISLSTWFRDYVYIPLGGNRVKVSRLYFNVAVVFILSGFWHGANWTFIIWGALHTIYLLVYMFFTRKTKKSIETERNYLSLVFSWGITFVFVCFAWIFFRASSLSDAIEYILAIGNNFDMGVDFRISPQGLKAGFGLLSYGIAIFASFVMFILEYKFSERMSEDLVVYRDILLVAFLVLIIVFFGVFQKSSFIYFQF